MDLINKEDIVLLKICEQCRKIARFFDGRSGGDTHVYAHFVGDNRGERCFTKARRAVEQNVVKRFSAHFCRLNENAKVFLCSVLPDILM